MDDSILVIGSGDECFREYALRGLAECHRVVLVGQAPLSWQLPYLADHREVAMQDRSAVLAAARELAARCSVRGVVTWDEMLVPLTADIGAELGVPGMPPAAARACRDKAIQRECFAATGVPSALFRLAGSLEEALAAAADIGYPVVVKPRGGAASLAIQLARTEDDLRRAFDLARSSGNRSTEDAPVLVEEFLEGPEVSVDSWVLGGRVEPYATALKRTDFPPFFEEVSHVVGDVFDAPTAAAVHDVVVRAHQALGIDRTVTHTELMLTADGPKVIEVNGRLGGDLIPHLSELATPGLSAGAVIGAVAAGREPAPTPPAARLMGIRFLYPPAAMVFADLDYPAELASESWVHEIRRVTEPGATLRLPPEQFLARAGYVIVTADTVAGVDERLAALANKVTVVGEPLATEE